MERRYRLPPPADQLEVLDWASPLRLPPEIIVAIGRHLDADSFFAMARVCRYFRSALLSSPSLLVERKAHWGMACEPTVEAMCRETGRARNERRGREALPGGLWDLIRRAERRWAE